MEPLTILLHAGGLSRRELHFIWLLGVSGSMNANGKIQAPSVAIRESIPQLQAAACGNPNVEVLERAIVFSNGARRHLEPPTPEAIGGDVNMHALQTFISDDNLRPLTANKPEALVQKIRWVSRSGVDSSASQVLDPESQRRAAETPPADDSLEW